MNRSGKLQDGSLPADTLFLFIQLLDAIFLENLQQWLAQRLGPKRIAIIAGVRAVHASLVRGRSGIGYLYVIYISIFLYGLAHKLFRTVLTFLFRAFRTSIEITALTIDGTLEYQRFSGMSLLKLLDEREKPFFNLFNRRVGKGIKNKGIRIRCAKHIAEIGLKLAVTGTTQVKDVQSCGTAQLRRVVHCGSGGAAAVSETATEESDAMAERIFKGQKCFSSLHANLQFAQLALDRKSVV